MTTTPTLARHRTPICGAAELLDRLTRHAPMTVIADRSGLTLRTLRRVQGRRQSTVHIGTLTALREAAFLMRVGDWPDLEVAA